MIASRPAAVTDFKSSATRQIEVLGFLKEQITECIQEYKFSDESKHSELVKYLDHYPHMCYLPIHTAMVYFLAQGGRNLPETETGIYNEFTICFFLRTLHKSNDDEEFYIESVESLPSFERKAYKKICKLAFETTVKSKQVVSEKEVKAYFSVHSNRDYLGLINVDKVALQHGFQKLYTFLHLTFQEFLAACHISDLDDDQQTKAISEHGNAKHLQVVWKFYCGLVKFGNHIKFDDLLEKIEYGTLYRVQCSFESQQPSTCDIVVEDSSLSFKDNFFTPSDFAAIAFVVSHATQNTISKLVFDECTLREEGIDILDEKAGDKLSSVTTLCFHGHNCVAEQLKMVNKLMHALPSLEVLDITNTQLGKEAVKALTSDLNHSNIQILKIDASDSNQLYSSDVLPQTLVESFKSQCDNFTNVYFTDYTKQHLSSLLHLRFYLCPVISKLLDVNMSFYHLELIEVKMISNDLRMNSVCRRLSLIGCSITDEGAKILCAGIECSNIEILELSLNRVGDEGATALSYCMKSCLSLHTLDLSCNLIGNDGAMAITRGIPEKIFKYFKLFLWNNKITQCGANSLLKVKNNIIFDSLDIEGRGDGAAAISLCIPKYHELPRSHPDKHNFESLCKLNLSSNLICDKGLTRITGFLELCTNLTSLNLSNNSIGINGMKAFANSLRNCTKLTYLDLSKNLIDHEGAVTLADGLKVCTRISSLNLSNNSMGDAGVKEFAYHTLRINSTSLTLLDLSSNSIGFNGIRTLADALKYCTNLTSLDLSGNLIGDDGTKALASVLKGRSNLLSLKIHRNDINGFNAVADIIKKCSKMHTLEIGPSDFASGIKPLSQCLKKCSDLKILSLRQACIGQEGIKSLAKGLKKSKALSEIDVHGNDIGDGGGIKAIASMLKICGSNLHALDIAKNNLGKDGAKALSGGIKPCCNLSKLIIADNSLGEDGSQALVKAISCCSNLHILDISRNSIGNNGIKALAVAIKCCINLHTLDVSHNRIKNDGSAALASAINQHSRLHTLDISYNYIDGAVADGAVADGVGADGAVALLNALKHCKYLHTLNISHNRLRKGGIHALAQAVKHCSTLHILHISSNYIGLDGGVGDLADAIICCSNLHTISINDNHFAAGDINVLAKALMHCSSLQVLDVSYNSIGNDSIHGLMKCCSKLQSLDISHSKIEEEGATAIGDSIKYCHNLNTLKLNKVGCKVIQRLLPWNYITRVDEDTYTISEQYPLKFFLPWSSSLLAKFAT